MFHAMYSEQQKQLFGSCFYFLMNSKEEIEVTSIAHTKEDLENPLKNFSDARYLGIVGEPSREGQLCSEKFKLDGYILRIEHEFDETLVKDARNPIRTKFKHHERPTTYNLHKQKNE